MRPFVFIQSTPLAGPSILQFQSSAIFFMLNYLILWPPAPYDMFHYLWSFFGIV